MTLEQDKNDKANSSRANESNTSNKSNESDPVLDAKITQNQKLHDKILNEAKVNLNQKLNMQYEYERYHSRMNSSEYTDQDKRNFRAENYHKYQRLHQESWIDPVEIDRFVFKEWYRQIRKQRLFKFTMIFTLLSGVGSMYAIYDDRQNAQRRHEGIFKDIIRQNVRRKLNGYVELNDEEIEVRFGKNVLQEYNEWKAKNRVLVRDIERKSLTPESMYQARRRDVV